MTNRRRSAAISLSFSSALGPSRNRQRGRRTARNLKLDNVGSISASDIVDRATVPFCAPQGQALRGGGWGVVDGGELAAVDQTVAWVDHRPLCRAVPVDDEGDGDRLGLGSLVGDEVEVNDVFVSAGEVVV